MSLRARRREQAKRRAKLGFVEEEVENPEPDVIVDKMERDDKNYQQKKLIEERTRKSIKLATQIQGISKAEHKSSRLHPDEMFQEE